MANFEIDGKEHEVKLTFKSIQEMNKKYTSPLEFAGQVLAGNIDTFVDAIYYGLLHTGDGITRKKVESAVEKSIEEETLDFQAIMRLGNEVVNESFFFRKIMEKLLAADPRAKDQLSALMK